MEASTHTWLTGLWQERRWLAYLCQAVPNLRGQHVRERHQLRRLVGGVAKHVALVAGANLLQRLGAQTVDALANVWRLLLNVHQHLRRHTRFMKSMFSGGGCWALWPDTLSVALQHCKDGEAAACLPPGLVRTCTESFKSINGGQRLVNPPYNALPTRCNNHTSLLASKNRPILRQEAATPCTCHSPGPRRQT